jgi:uncharacterized membrane protein SirB2
MISSYNPTPTAHWMKESNGLENGRRFVISILYILFLVRLFRKKQKRFSDRKKMASHIISIFVYMIIYLVLTINVTLNMSYIADYNKIKV